MDIISRIDRRMELAKRLQQEWLDSVKPWMRILVEIEGRHLPNIYMDQGQPRFESNYSAEDAQLRDTVLKIINEIHSEYENRCKFKELGQ